MDAVLEQFLSEARENLAFIDKNLEQLSSDDPEVLNALFRAAHTLKGGAGLVGLEAVKTITHYAEDLFDGIKKGEITYTEDMLDTLYDAFDEIVEMIDATEESGEIPEFDEDRVNEIASSVQALTGKEQEKVDEDALDTELNIISSEENPIGELISNYNFSSFIKELDFSLSDINQEFIEEENIYLIDMDLDEQTCELGNDPVYLAYLIGSENIYSVSCRVFSECNELASNPTLWKTRITLVVKSDKDTLEDSLYNILDDVTIYPLSIKSLLNTSYPSVQNDVFDDFAKDFQKILDEGDFADLSEKLSAVTKILNPESKEGFILSRLEVILPYLEFEGIDYLELIKYASYLLGLGTTKEENTTEDTQDEAIKEEETKDLTAEKNTVVNALKQQLKVLKFAKDDMALSRVRLHSKTSLEFIGIETDFHNNDTKEELAQKIIKYIIDLKPDEDLSEFKTFSSNKKEVVEEKVNEKNVRKEVEEIQQPLKKETKQPPKEEPKVEIKKEIKKPESKKETPKPAPKQKEEPIKPHPSAVPKTVKIDQEDIDNMMDIIGELLVMKNALPYIANNITPDLAFQAKAELIAKYEEINRVTEQLQDIVMGMRLLPLSYIFSRYPKLVRETSKKLGKKIRFEEYGGETKLDKMMIEKIADPLVHIIRNSLDHGIELSEQDRIESGKDPVGLIRIGAKSIGDKVHIIIEDDGRGINTQKVLLKALELGIVTEEQIESMDEQEKLMMIFNPGLSTAEEITDISGRGVGTDAVMKTITELNGNIYLQSEQGKGTTVTIELPVSVALTNVFCVKMDNNNYAIAMENVIETIKISSKDMQIANNKPYARLRGEIIPLVFEHRLLGSNAKERERYSIVIVQATELRYGLVVDEFVNQLDVVQKPLEGAIANHPLISGTSLLGNGEILFVLDVNAIVQ